MTKSAATAIADLLDDTKQLLITSHRDPDGDSLGCQLAFYEYWVQQRNKKADVVDQGPVPGKYGFLDPDVVVKRPGKALAHRRWDSAIIFECSSLDRIGSVEKLLSPDVRVINIDHHERNACYGVINVLEPRAAACAEMVYDMLRLWKATITPSMAEKLATAIVTDTGRFGHPCTNQRTVEVTAQLVRLGADLSKITNHVYHSQSRDQFHLVHHVLGKADLRSRGRICFLHLRIADRKKYSVPMHELEGLVDHTLSVKGVKMGALLKELGPRKTKASLRSAGSVNVAALARRFGGGGHRNAAGCIIDLPIRETADLLEQSVGKLSDSDTTAPENDCD